MDQSNSIIIEENSQNDTRIFGASTASTFSIVAEPPEVGAGSNDVGLTVIHFFLSLLLIVAKAFPA